MARAKRSDPPTGADEPPFGEDAAAAVPEPAAPSSDMQDEIIALAEPAAAPPDEEPLRQPMPSVRPAAPQTVILRRGGFVPLALGGIVAAAAGAAGVLYALPYGWGGGAPGGTDETIAALTGRVNEAAAKADAAGKSAADAAAALAALPAPADPSAAVAAATDKITALGTAFDDLSARMVAIDDRLVALEKRPVAGGAASASAIDAFQTKLAALRAEIEAQKGAASQSQSAIVAAADEAAARIKAAEEEAARLRAESEAAAKAASARAALSHVQAALESGAPMDGALADLASAGIAVPQPLTDQSAGIPSLAALRAAFPPAARDSLTISLRDTAGEGIMARMGAFLRSQSGARSLAPRAGDDPDAVLSRAEAALTAGDLAGAVRALSALPPSGQARMAEWVALAQRRMAAADAAAALAAQIN